MNTEVEAARESIADTLQKMTMVEREASDRDGIEVTCWFSEEQLEHQAREAWFRGHRAGKLSVDPHEKILRYAIGFMFGVASATTIAHLI